MSDAGARDGLGDVVAAAGAAAYPGDTPVADSVEPAAPAEATVGQRRAPLVVAAVLTLFFLAAAWFAFRRGVLTDTWPAFLPDTDSTSITRYSGPWLTVAALSVLGFGLSVMALVRSLVAR